MLADFTITINEGRKPMGVRVVVHETVQELRKAAQMHYNNWRNRTPQPDLDEIAGVCHRYHMADDPVYAVVRLAPPDHGVGILAHELAHAAIHLWDVETKWDPKKKLGCENDEWFCLVLGELMSHAVRAMYERGVYQ